MINILFFARLKDQLQTESLQVELQESINTIEELKQWLQSQLTESGKKKTERSN